MSHIKMLSSSSHIRHSHLSLQPAPAWIAILGFVFFSALCILAGAGSIMRLAFPVGAFVVGVFLYRRYPILYVGFTWWLWFLTPLVRRLIDYRSGWVEPNPVLLAPFLATLVTLATFLRYIPKSYRQGGFPFVLSCTGVFYAFVVGLVNSMLGGTLNSVIQELGEVYTPSSVIVDTLQWITPILFSFHLFVNWQYYPKYRRNIQRNFFWAVLVTGGYGVLQYLVAPEWDRFWLTNVIKIGITSFGLPEPLGIRVFSTMNSPGTFAAVMMSGLLLLLSGKGTLRFFATAVGALALLLTLVRTVWGGFTVGILVFITSLKANLQMRLIVTILIVGICVFPLTTVEPFSQVINARLQTLSNVQEDGSYQERAETYNRVLGVALFEPLGNGLGHPAFDSTVIDMLLAMGWLGAIPYVGGLVLLLFQLRQCIERRFDSFMSAANSISLAMLAQLGFGNGLIELGGLMFWGFLGIVLAGHKYYQHQRTLQTSETS